MLKKIWFAVISGEIVASRLAGVWFFSKKKWNQANANDKIKHLICRDLRGNLGKSQGENEFMASPLLTLPPLTWHGLILRGWFTMISLEILANWGGWFYILTCLGFPIKKKNTVVRFPPSSLTFKSVISQAANILSAKSQTADPKLS